MGNRILQNIYLIENQTRSILLALLVKSLKKLS